MAPSWIARATSPIRLSTVRACYSSVIGDGGWTPNLAGVQFLDSAWREFRARGFELARHRGPLLVVAPWAAGCVLRLLALGDFI